MADPAGGTVNQGQVEPEVVIVGAGGHARVVADAFEGRVVGHLSPSGSTTDRGASIGPRLGADEDLQSVVQTNHVIAIGIGFVDREGAVRRRLLVDSLERTGLATVVHRRAIVSDSAELAAGVFVAAGAVIGPHAVIGVAGIVNSGAVVEHDCRLGRNVHVGPGCTLSGGVDVGDDVLVGVGATVLQGVRIGNGAVVGAGAVVIHDVPDGATAVGVPARIVS